MLGPNRNLVAVGPPLINPYPNLTDPNPPLPARDDARAAPAPPTRTWRPSRTRRRCCRRPHRWPSPRLPQRAAAWSPLAPRSSSATGRTGTLAPAGLLPAEAAPASFGGNVGPGSQERVALSVVTGQFATTATQLLGPVAPG